jgi:hypothetical protein
MYIVVISEVVGLAPGSDQGRAGAALGLRVLPKVVTAAAVAR